MDSVTISGDAKPFISVITVAFNDAGNLDATIQSVVAQSYDQMEYIIIDGGSSDETVEVIKRYGGAVDTWVSEPDQGIYDAMNKGVSLANGQWVHFLNAGDLFYAGDTLQKLSRFCDKGDLVYGRCNVRYADGCQRAGTVRPLSTLWRGMPFSHQGMLTRTALLRSHPFDLRRKLCADFDFVYRAYLRGDVFVDSDHVIAQVSAGGVSDCRRVEVLKENYSIVRGETVKPSWYMYFRAKMLLECLKHAAKRCLSSRMIKMLRKS